MKFEPVIKWSGSKRNSSLAIVSFFPKEIDTYYEPFVGGGSILYQLLHSDIKVKHFVASDQCKELIGFWNMLKQEPEFLCLYYKKRWKELQANGDAVYFSIRDAFNISKFPEQLFFLSRTCYNGLIRFNSNGQFNTAFHIGRPGIHPDKMEATIIQWSSKIQDIKFVHQDFSEIRPKDKDFVYMDPPYINSPEMYFGGFEHGKLFAWMKTLPCRYAMSFDGKTKDSNDTFDVPSELYCRHEYIKSGGSSFLRLRKQENVQVSESLYLNYENDV